MTSNNTPLRALSLAFALALAPALAADDWPQWRGPHRDGVWREDGIVETLPKQIPIKWRVKIGAGYAGPAVAAGRVYVVDRILEEGQRNPDNPFSREKVIGKERVLCLDSADGKVAWKHEYGSQYTVSYPAGPRATPTIDEGRVYTVGVMGDFHCLDAKTGKVIWHSQFTEDFKTEINTWGMSAAPLIDGDRVIVLAGGSDGSTVVAFDKANGKVLWKALDSGDPGYCPPEIIESGGRRQLIIWTPKAVQALSPDSGELLWSQDFAINSALSVASPIFDAKRQRLLVSAFYNGSVMLQLDSEKPGSRILWRGKSSSEKKTDGLHAMMCTPFFDGEHLYGVCSYGQLRCLEAGSGERVWETVDATGSGRWWNAFLVRHGERTVICNEQGELIFAKLSPKGYEELSRGKLIEPTNPVRRRMTVWSHPAFAERCVFARNDGEIVCADLSAKAK